MVPSLQQRSREDRTPREERRIEFVETLGRGGFGSVYLADVHGDNDFVQRLAVKVLNDEVGRQPDLVARQRDEARLLAQLNHDHIVKVMDLTEMGGRPVILMEYVDGIDAAHLLRHAAFPIRAALEVGAAVASALAAAFQTVSPRTGAPLHAVHRDIKPSNLLVSSQGGIKVLDFGVARASFDREGTSQSLQFGTPRFMAPEQWLHNQSGPEVDVFALALTLVALLTGAEQDRLPLERKNFDAQKAIVLARLMPTPGELQSELLELLDRMLSFDAKARPAAQEVHERLGALAEKSPGEALGRFARRMVPALVIERRAYWGQVPLTADPIAGDPTWSSARGTNPVQGPDSKSSLVTETPKSGMSTWVGAALLGVVLVTGGVWGWVHASAQPVAAVPLPDRPTPVAPVLEPADHTPIDVAPPVVETIETPLSAAEAPAPPKPRQVVASPPEAIAPEAAPEPPVATGPLTHITISSAPLHEFTVVVDGKERGPTPVALDLVDGRHDAVLVGPDGVAVPRELVIASHAPTHYTWDSDSGHWRDAP